MIQRLQTIYFIAIILICAMLCSGSVINMHTVINNVNRDYTMNFMYYKVYENGQMVESHTQYISIIFVSLIIGWTIKVIFDYKNRTTQIKNAKINFIFMTLLIAGLFSLATVYIPGFNLSTLNFNSVFGIALMIFMYYLNIRAIMLIRKDDNLVKSADRIR